MVQFEFTTIPEGLEVTHWRLPRPFTREVVGKGIQPKRDKGTWEAWRGGSGCLCRAFLTAPAAACWDGTGLEPGARPLPHPLRSWVSSSRPSLAVSCGKIWAVNAASLEPWLVFFPMLNDYLSTQHRYPSSPFKGCVLSLRVPQPCCLFLLSLGGSTSGYEEVQVLFL